ncbi:unnamed protein product [Schistocephalus solidus]|uniref:Uncharacterized protein n=1 Tax=Schistocephalus solidus TaxID=70667 RepID=A0A3P7DI94_SCHSO|nr:unnamed protein product [Schistocephalus solidus]
MKALSSRAAILKSRAETKKLPIHFAVTTNVPFSPLRNLRLHRASFSHSQLTVLQDWPTSYQDSCASQLRRSSSVPQVAASISATSVLSAWAPDYPFEPFVTATACPSLSRALTPSPTISEGLSRTRPYLHRLYDELSHSSCTTMPMVADERNLDLETSSLATIPMRHSASPPQLLSISALDLAGNLAPDVAISEAAYWTARCLSCPPCLGVAASAVASSHSPVIIVTSAFRRCLSLGNLKSQSPVATSNARTCRSAVAAIFDASRSVCGPVGKSFLPNSGKLTVAVTTVSPVRATTVGNACDMLRAPLSSLLSPDAISSSSALPSPLSSTSPPVVFPPSLESGYNSSSGRIPNDVASPCSYHLPLSSVPSLPSIPLSPAPLPLEVPPPSAPPKQQDAELLSPAFDYPPPTITHPCLTPIPVCQGSSLAPVFPEGPSSPELLLPPPSEPPTSLPAFAASTVVDLPMVVGPSSVVPCVPSDLVIPPVGSTTHICAPVQSESWFSLPPEFTFSTAPPPSFSQPLALPYCLTGVPFSTASAASLAWIPTDLPLDPPRLIQPGLVEPSPNQQLWPPCYCCQLSSMPAMLAQQPVVGASGDVPFAANCWIPPFPAVTSQCCSATKQLQMFPCCCFSMRQQSTFVPTCCPLLGGDFLQSQQYEDMGCATCSILPQVPPTELPNFLPPPLPTAPIASPMLSKPGSLTCSLGPLPSPSPLPPPPPGLVPAPGFLSPSPWSTGFCERSVYQVQQS